MTDDTLAAAEIEERAGSDLAAACDQARELVAAHPEDESAAKLLHKLVQRAAREASPAKADGPQLAAPVAEASRLLNAGQDEPAEIMLRTYLRQWPNDTAAMALMAEIANRCGLHEDAERILARAVQLDASSADLWLALGQTTHRRIADSGHIKNVDQALGSIDQALRRDPTHEAALSFKSGVEVQLRRLPEAHATFMRLLAVNPCSPQVWTNFAFLLKTMGQFGESIAAYRTAVALRPANATAWLGLANLKLARFFPADVKIMEEVLGDEGVDDRARVELHMTLARALDGPGRFEEAVGHLEQAGELRSNIQKHDADAITSEVSQAVATFTPAFFSRREGWGCPASDPIFILGMPRSGSTLVEQILSSHTAIEGTEELFIVQQLATEITLGQSAKLDAVLPSLEESQVRALGERYLTLAQVHRKTERPRFTDKTPASWRQIGLIHAILPSAKIIDIRRNPMDCCFANYAQHFHWGANFSYRQTDLARYYRDYVRLMRHFDEVLPGRIHRIIYEDLVDNLEQEVRPLLDYLGLPFEDSCLRFFETDRAIHTPSSEQVRQPINRSGIGRWKNYEPWLGELKGELGEVMTDWRG